MDVSGDIIADLVLRQFDSLSPKRKPLPRQDGSREWVPLAGIVAETSNGLKCIALGTGMKCLPATKLSSCNGNVLHDWHAEIVAIRCLNRLLLEECLKLAAASRSCSGQEVFESEFVRLREKADISDEHFQSFAINDGIRFHMYCSEAPCGDASMELIMAQQADPTPWSIPVPDPPSDSNASTAALLTPTILPGRANFSLLSVVRRKPSRPDAAPTSSKSCTDKLAHYQCSSFLSSITSLVINPSNAYLSTLVLPESQLVEQAVVRAFETRFKELRTDTWKGGYGFHPFKIKATRKEFIFSRRYPVTSGSHHDGSSSSLKDIEDASAVDSTAFIPSNVAASFHSPAMSETLIAGVLQGRKQNDPRGASMLSRRRMWMLTQDILSSLDDNDGHLKLNRQVENILNEKKYGNLKRSKVLASRTDVKVDTRTNALKGWIKGEGDEDWGLDG